MELQLLELGENRERFLQLRRSRLFIRLCGRSFKGSAFLGCRLFLPVGLPLLSRLRSSAIFWSVLMLMMLFLNDFLRVCDVSRVSHEFIDASQGPVGRI